MAKTYLKIEDQSRSAIKEDDLADGRAMGAHPETFSGREYCRRPARTEADCDASGSRSSSFDFEHGGRWHMLPQRYPSYKTVQRRFQSWCRNEVLRRILTDVANELREKGAIDEEACFIDANFAMAKGGGVEIGPTRREKGLKIMAIVDSHGLPLSVSSEFPSNQGDGKKLND